MVSGYPREQPPIEECALKRFDGAVRMALIGPTRNVSPRDAHKSQRSRLHFQHPPGCGRQRRTRLRWRALKEGRSSDYPDRGGSPASPDGSLSVHCGGMKRGTPKQAEGKKKRQKKKKGKKMGKS